MTEWRRHPRVKESAPVQWTFGFLGHQGQAVIRNLSISGLMLEVDSAFEPVEDGKYHLEVQDPKLSSIMPREVKLIWCSRDAADKTRKFCGMKFIQSEGPVFMRLVEHVESKRSNFNEAMDAKIIQHYLTQSN